MMSHKKKIISLVLVFLLIFVMGCSKTKIVNNNTPADTTKTDTPIKPLEEGDKVLSKDEIDTSEEDAFAKTLLNDIKDLAESGKIIKCDFGVKNTNLTNVEESWGEADSTDYVPAAKGTYSTYNVHRVAFGWNKGMQIFEARSFEEELGEITYGLVEENFGTPNYSTECNGEKIIGYTAGEEFKILFVFPMVDNMKEAKLNHYSVLYSAGTVNSMANDPGREW